MRRSRTLDSVVTPDGRELVLSQRDDLFVIRVDDVELMSNRAYGSEEKLARLGLAALGARPAPRVLVGGLGMGFTLRAVLDDLAGRHQATVTVAELFPTVIEWSRTWLGHLANHPLDDPRVRIVTGDVASLLMHSPQSFDLVLLDVDNGPEALTLDANDHLYTPRGITTLRNALRPGGVAAVWSAGHDTPFVARLQRGGFDVEVHQVTARPGGKGDRHVIFLGRKL
jgi:spermidine synthase